MTELRSPATGKRYRLSQICRVWRLSRSQYYAQKKRALENPTASESPKRRGPLGAGSDAELISSLTSVAELNEVLAAFKAHYNSSWLVAKHHYLTPSELRVQFNSVPTYPELLSVAS